ncbi:hypothetical protein AAY473_023290 [Plecturocebus cupreus]
MNSNNLYLKNNLWSQYGGSRLESKQLRRPRYADHLTSGVQDQPGQHGETLPLRGLPDATLLMFEAEHRKPGTGEKKPKHIDGLETGDEFKTSLANRVKPASTENTKVSHVWWCPPGIPADWEAEAPGPGYSLLLMVPLTDTTGSTRSKVPFKLPTAGGLPDAAMLTFRAEHRKPETGEKKPKHMTDREGREWFWDSTVIGFLLSQPGQLKAIMTARSQDSEEKHRLTRTAPRGDGQDHDTGNT